MKSLSKKRVGLYGSVITAVLVVSLIVVFMQNSGLVPTSKVAFAAGTPDALGNRIATLNFHQNASGTWANVASLAYASYTAGYTLTIPSNQHTIILIEVRLNYSLASSVAIASGRARVYITITGVVTGASFIYVSGTEYSGGGDHYWLLAYCYPSSLVAPTTTWIPATDVTYNVTCQYQAYY